MGGSTFLIGCIPAYATIGAWAPVLVLLLRLLQGLALGGEYGGAATYVAEHAPADRRGYFTSWIQTTATLGLFLSLIVILGIRRLVGVEQFSTGNGWRYPFLLSIVLVIVSVIIRLKMNESPLFAKLKAEGKTSVNPLKESFGHKTNFKMVLVALFGATMGQGVIWYTSQFYAQTFILTKCSLEYEQANTIILIALVAVTPFFIAFGSLSDKWGRKNIILVGMLLGCLLYRPIFKEMYATADVLQKTIIAEETKIDYKAELVKGTVGDSLHITTVQNFYGDGTKQKIVTQQKILASGEKVKPEVKKETVLGEDSRWKMIGLIAVMVLFVTMVYGPIAAYLVELFPTRIRYTSMSLPYHIGNGVFGGLVPFIALLITTLPGTNYLSGLWYPIGVAALSFIIGALYLTNKTNKNVDD
ncbi:MAG TPA: MFS transporter, partial [Chitinophagaceae bacterium]